MFFDKVLQSTRNEKTQQKETKQNFNKNYVQKPKSILEFFHSKVQ